MLNIADVRINVVEISLKMLEITATNITGEYLRIYLLRSNCRLLFSQSQFLLNIKWMSLNRFHFLAAFSLLVAVELATPFHHADYWSSHFSCLHLRLAIYIRGKQSLCSGWGYGPGNHYQSALYSPRKNYELY